MNEQALSALLQPQAPPQNGEADVRRRVVKRARRQYAATALLTLAPLGLIPLVAQFADSDTTAPLAQPTTGGLVEVTPSATALPGGSTVRDRYTPDATTMLLLLSAVLFVASAVACRRYLKAVTQPPVRSRFWPLFFSFACSVCLGVAIALIISS